MSGKPGTSDKAKTVVYTRFDPEKLDALDKISSDHPLKPSRARLIEAAVDEYIERYGGKRKSAK
jgi:hypothetical protein